VRLLAQDELPAPDSLECQFPHQDLSIPRSDSRLASFPTALHFKGSEDFSQRLGAKSKEIKSTLSTIFTNLTNARGKPGPDLEELQAKLTKLLASQKEYMVRLDRLRTEKDELSERLETASLRYLKSEKRLERARSSAVAKIEQQAMAGTGNSAGSGIGSNENGDVEMTNGIPEEMEASQSAYKEAAAVVAKQKEQLETVMLENKTLTEQLTAASIKFTNLTEDDYARTELFKQLRTQHDDLIKRINHLEATHIQLREEAEKYQAERTAYRAQIENESEILTGELESQIQRIDADLTRIRSTRDELLADLSIRKASQEQDHAALEHMKELVGAKDDRIAALELEVERVRSQAEAKSCAPTPRSDVDSLGMEELRQKYEAQQQAFESINREMPALQNAYKRVQALSSRKVMDFTALEEKIQVFAAEKAKADQKYFAARKDMDTRLGEVRALRTQNSKSSEIISQLKDVETSNRTLLSNLEKQLSELRQSNISIVADNKKLEASSRDATSKMETLKNQVTELTNLLKSKDSANINTKQRIQSVEIELEQVRVKCEQAQKDRDMWKHKSLSNQSGEEEMLRVSHACLVALDTANK